MQQAVTHNENNDEIEISLADIVKTLYDGRWFIVLGTVVCVLLVLGGAFVTAKYKSSSSWYFDGLVKVSGESGESGISVAKYDRIMDSAKTSERFEAYIQNMNLPALPEVDMLRQLFASREGIGAQIKPFRSSLATSESKSKKEEEKAPILGVSLEIQSKSRELAHATLTLLSSYLTDTLLYDFYYDSVLGKRNHYQTLGAKTENGLIDLKIQRPQLEQQQKILEALIEKYTRLLESSRKAEKADVVITSDESTLGSSPVIQLMNLQLKIAGLDAQEEALHRKQKQVGLFLDFYQKVVDLHQRIKSSKLFFEQLSDLLPQVFAGKDMNDEVIKEAYNDLFMEVESAQNLYQTSSRLMVQPSTPSVPTTRFGLIAAVALLAGLMLSALLVLIRGWWKEVKAAS